MVFLNVSLLSEEEYLVNMRTKLQELKVKYSNLEDYNLKWELIKYEIRKFSISYSKKRKHKMIEDKKTKEQQLE